MALILAVYIILSWYVGYVILIRIVPKLPGIFLIVGSYLLGTAIAVPVAYILSFAFARTNEPLLWGTVVATLVLGVVGVIFRRRITLFFSFSDILCLLFSFGISYWLMFKTFHGDASGVLFVGSNNVFDFGLSLGLIRSISQGANIALDSPFFSGVPMFYHFFFPFYCALWEYFGIPTVWAVNGPSILSFASLLIVIFSFSEIVGIKGKLVGWLAVALTITHPTVTFWKYIAGNGISIETLKGLWQIPTYPYAGPFDGSTVSIFMTLNNYVNQRHLAFAVALGLVLYVVAWKIITQTKKIGWYTPAVIGCFVGGMFYWNVVIWAVVAVAIILLFAVYKQVKLAIIFGSAVGAVVFLSLIPYIPILIELFGLARHLTGATFSSSPPTWSIWTYLWENLTLFPFVLGMGYVVCGKKRQLFLPIIVLFILVCFLAGYHHRGFDQKLLSFSIIPLNLVAAVALLWLWSRKELIAKIISCLLFVVLTISGAVDLLVVKNEFAYPLVSRENSAVISWIQTHTPKNAVFISYPDMIDPVVLAGRKNYFGYFGNIGESDRSPAVKNIYAGDVATAKKLGISYILMPKWNKSDFPYIVDTMYFQEHNMMVYDDEKYRIFIVRGQNAL